MRWALALLLLALLLTAEAEDAKKKKKKSRKTRSLPSVSDHHYSELFHDGSYKFAYLGDDRRYHAELRTRDGLVEGETYHVRPDGIPIKVHYFADKNGYRPKTEVLYTERERVPDPNVVFLNPEGGQGRSDIGHTAVASPSVTAILGPNAVAVTSPQVSASAGPGGAKEDFPNYPNPVSAEELARILRIIAESRSGGIQRQGKQLGQHVEDVNTKDRVYVYPAADEWASGDKGRASYSYSYAYALPGQDTYKDSTGFVSVKVNSN